MIPTFDIKRGRDNANEHNIVLNPNWQEADQLAIYKRGGGVELRSVSIKHGLQTTD